MDKRIVKTENAIYHAFTEVLNSKNYSNITIEDILKESKISRSTFYSHFKTKEDVLRSVIDHIFDHVFSHSLSQEKTHDFSKSNIFDYAHLITHILYHLHDEKKLVKAILSNSTRDIFFNNVRERMNSLAKFVVNDLITKNNDIPEELYVSKVIEIFILCIDYWFKTDCKESPEKITNYFFMMNDQK